MEKAILNIDRLNISQGMLDSFSHSGDLAIDMTDCTYLKAPFTGVIKRIYPYCNAVWLESLEPVEFADGTIDYMTVMTFHDDDVSNLYVGKIVYQGEEYYNPGLKGYVTGSHIHIAVSKGKYINSGWYQNEYGTWCIHNQYDITKALFLDSNVKIISSPYNFKIYNNNDNFETYNLKSVDQLIYEVINGLWGNNPERQNRLIQAGYDYNLIQEKVDQIMNNNQNTETSNLKSIDQLAQEVINGLWGNNPERKNHLIQAGYNYDLIQEKVDEIMNNKLNKNNSVEIIYIVKSGDCLINIGKMFNKDWQEIARKNNITEPYIIYPGQELII